MFKYSHPLVSKVRAPRTTCLTQHLQALSNLQSDVFWTAKAENHSGESVDGRGAAMFRRTAVYIRSW
jgi:hypothetical protein